MSVLLLVIVQGGRVRVPLTLMVTVSVTAKADGQARHAIKAVLNSIVIFMVEFLCLIRDR